MSISQINPHPLPVYSDYQREALIGELLLEMGKLTRDELDRINILQQTSGMRFGETARKLGLVMEADILEALAVQFGYPCLQAGQKAFSQDLVAAYQPYSQRVEALRALRSQLVLRWFHRGNKVLAVVAANPGDGCSNLAANLSVVFAQLGERTLLIDANLRDPSQRDIFNLNQRKGLSDILIGRADMDVITKIESLAGLSVLGAGTVPPNPQELLGRNGFDALINKARDQYDVVIVDTPPAVLTSDAQAVAARCGGALLVSRLNQTRMADLANVRDQLLICDVQVVAAIVNDL